MQSETQRFHPWLLGLGALLLVYAVAGNYVALPGYLRYLERGGTSAAGNSFDMDVLIGAVKTIVWMYSFQLGALVMALTYAIREKLHSGYLALGGLIWLTLWSWPELPKPGAWFYLTFGSLLILTIPAALLKQGPMLQGRTSRTLFVASLLFFAFATWEVCGLGSTGRMLDPHKPADGLAQTLLVTQSSKLMIEFVLAWGLMLASYVTRDKAAQ